MRYAKFFLLLVALVALAGCGSTGGPATNPVADTSSPNVATVAPQSPVPPTPEPLPTATPIPTATRLTEPGCCTQPFWTPDSARVVFIDRPDALQPVGLYGVDLAGGVPSLVTERLGEYSPDGRYVAYPENGQTYVEEFASGVRWLIDNKGTRVTFSPSGQRVAWTISSTNAGNFDIRTNDTSVARIDGTPEAGPFSFVGGGFNGWLDDDRILVVGRLPDDVDRALYALALPNGELTELARGERVRSGIPSPGGAWVLYLVLFEQTQPEDNGFWIVSADGQQRFQLDVFGAVQWRDENRLLVVLQEMNATSQRIVEIDARTGESRNLTDPALTPIPIEAGDWRVSPDGSAIVFVSSVDRAIWWLPLPP